MGSKSKPDAEAGLALSKERVLKKALEIADKEGIDALSMRRLARELGAGAMSLYHYVKDKDQLLDGMVDLVFAEIALPEPGADWQKAMRARAISAREVLVRHPWAIALMESRGKAGPAGLKHREAVLATLRQAGFSIQMAVHANWLLDSYIYGFVLQETNLPFSGSNALVEMTQDVFLPQIPPVEYPNLNEVATTLMQSGYDPADEFLYGLNLIFDGLKGAVA